MVALLMPASSPGDEVEHLGAEAAALGPAQVHAQQHLRPVLRLGAAGARVDGEDGVAVVVLAAEHQLELELVDLPCCSASASRVDVGGDALVVLGGGQFDKLEQVRGSAPRPRHGSIAARRSERRRITCCAACGSSQKSGAADCVSSAPRLLLSAGDVKDAP